MPAPFSGKEKAACVLKTTDQNSGVKRMAHIQCLFLACLANTWWRSHDLLQNEKPIGSALHGCQQRAWHTTTAASKPPLQLYPHHRPTVVPSLPPPPDALLPPDP